MRLRSLCLHGLAHLEIQSLWLIIGFGTQGAVSRLYLFSSFLFCFGLLLLTLGVGIYALRCGRCNNSWAFDPGCPGCRLCGAAPPPDSQSNPKSHHALPIGLFRWGAFPLVNLIVVALFVMILTWTYGASAPNLSMNSILWVSGGLLTIHLIGLASTWGWSCPTCQNPGIWSGRMILLRDCPRCSSKI